MRDEQVYFANHAGLCVFKFVGELRHTSVEGMDGFIRHLFEQQHACSRVSVDLTETEYMDSTCLGLLAMLARLSLSNSKGKPNLFCTNANMLLLLKSMCLDQVFHFVEERIEDIQMDELITESTADAQAELIYQAHKELSALSEENRKLFQPVVELMEKERQGN